MDGEYGSELKPFSNADRKRGCPLDHLPLSNLGELSNWLAQQTVNLPPSGLGGSSPSSPTKNCSNVSVTSKSIIRKRSCGSIPAPGTNLKKKKLPGWSSG